LNNFWIQDFSENPNEKPVEDERDGLNSALRRIKIMAVIFIVMAAIQLATCAQYLQSYSSNNCTYLFNCTYLIITLCCFNLAQQVIMYLWSWYNSRESIDNESIKFQLKVNGISGMCMGLVFLGLNIPATILYSLDNSTLCPNLKSNDQGNIIVSWIVFALMIALGVYMGCKKHFQQVQQEQQKSNNV